uniref:Uncharacterized protein n=1 Tax=Parastrongyloides trichosuri TaxID=131310 RepID=A0A0N4ZJY5_PARTI
MNNVKKIATLNQQSVEVVKKVVPIPKVEEPKVIVKQAVNKQVSPPIKVVSIEKPKTPNSLEGEKIIKKHDVSEMLKNLKSFKDDDSEMSIKKKTIEKNTVPKQTKTSKEVSEEKKDEIENYEFLGCNPNPIKDFEEQDCDDGEDEMIVGSVLVSINKKPTNNNEVKQDTTKKNNSQDKNQKSLKPKNEHLKQNNDFEEVSFKSDEKVNYSKKLKNDKESDKGKHKRKVEEKCTKNNSLLKEKKNHKVHNDVKSLNKLLKA